MPAKLFLLSGSEVEPESPFAVPEDRRVVVGRGHEADFVLLDREVSREHFCISHDGRDFILEDLDSANGTRVNGSVVHGATPLSDGDSIEAGAVQLRFAAAEEAKEEPAGPDGATAALPREQKPRDEAKVVRIPLAPSADEPEAHADHTVRAFLAKHPKDTADQVFRWWQTLWYVALLLGAFVLLNYNPVRFLHVFHLFCSFYLIVIAYKLAAVLLSVIKRGEVRITAEEVSALKDEDLPVYTILVPLYHETEVASKITRYISRLDYPQEKLDIKLLLEADDEETVAVCKQARLPANYELLIVPDHEPKTKPKACNHGLERARGEYLVIYDAEDRPEPDQLKKSVVAFRKLDEAAQDSKGLFRRDQTVCLQAKLNYFNPRQNLLTKWFTIEYSTWFDLFLPGLHRLRSPIPLGGTSNHFKTEVLQSIGGWDPFNVTEDCDLGIRLHKMGYNTQVLDSTTWEEANSRTWNWVRQRSRWVKGYVQTHLVHMRNPFATFWKLGPAGTLGFLCSVGGLSLMLLLNPIFWLIILFYAACWIHDLAWTGWSWAAARGFQAGFEPGRWPWNRWFDGEGPLGINWDGPWVWRMWFNDPRGDPFWNTWSQVFFILTVVLFLANFFFVFMHVAACVRRRMPRLIPHAIISPLYWVLISIGAWKGFLQLFSNPFKWEKTHHGLDAPQAAAGDSGSSPPSASAAESSS
jgi:cellulose synthase/poly-beta-1,6-N-acetylglucosamine synthase-like glycosyltransferase